MMVHTEPNHSPVGRDARVFNNAEEAASFMASKRVTVLYARTVDNRTIVGYVNEAKHKVTRKLSYPSGFIGRQKRVLSR